MQKCGSCGAYFSDFDKECPHCGWKTDAASENVQESKPETAEEIREVKPSETRREVPNPAENEDKAYPFTEPVQTSYPMKWHSFLMIVMIVGPVYSIIRELTDITNQGTAMDLIYSLAAIAVAVFGLYVRSRLYHFRKDGPNLLTALYVITAVVNLAYIISVKFELTNADAETTAYLNSMLAGEVIASLIMIYATRKYYNKRRDMFVN